MENDLVVIVQARMESQRFPGKVISHLMGQPMILWQLDRLTQMKTPHSMVVAVPRGTENISMCDLVRKHGHDAIIAPGDQEDVLARYVYASARYNSATDIVRITGDCPLIDAHIVDGLVTRHRKTGADHTGIAAEWGDGFDCEVFTLEALNVAYRDAKLPSEREHVTPYMYNHPELFKLATYPCPFDLSWMRCSVDTEEDMEHVASVVQCCVSLYGMSFGWRDILAALEYLPETKAYMIDKPINQSYVEQVSTEQNKPVSWNQSRYHGEF